MTASGRKTVRCAIYTRVSTDQGLEQEFNSLDAQCEASEAYIRSQAHAGWTLIKAKYDDGGFSGGNTERPALQRLLSDVQAGKIDVIVVYKVDRLTRSLADFAKLVELFDQHDVSFVSVTQQFNTTSSMGRLTLNVLLSFAQFEREVTSERIRDKIAASKRKGLWVGGMAPLGYDTKNRKITVNKREAESVRTIFRRYLELGSLNLLMVDLRKRGLVTKVRTLKSGKIVGGIPFTRGTLGHLLRNPFYKGQVFFKGETLPGEQVAIVNKQLFEAVQAKLNKQLTNHKAKRSKLNSLLMGRLFDERGHKMSPSYTCKQGVKYCYYISSALTEGKKELAGAINRVSAHEIESVVVKALRDNLNLPKGDSGTLIHDHVRRVDIGPGKLIIALVVKDNAKKKKSRDRIEVRWQKTSHARRREILQPANASSQVRRPMRSHNRTFLISSIARGRRWLKELTSEAQLDVRDIAAREECSTRKINMMISLAFLAPNLVKAAIEGRLPPGMGVAKLSDLPADWADQHRRLGLAHSN